MADNIFEKKFVPVTEDSALSMGSGSLEVLSTPVAIAYLENVSLELIEPMLDEGQTSVGTLIDVRHVRASRIGQSVIARSELVNADGRRYCFNVVLEDESGNVLAEGKHERFAVNAERFMSRL